MKTSYEHSNFYFMKYLFFLIGAFAFTSCTKEVITPKANTSEYKLIKEGKQDKLSYRIYDMGTEYGSVYVQARSPRGHVNFIAQANPDLTGYEFVMPDDYISPFCWDCVDDCLETNVDNNTAVLVTMTPFCPECTVAFVTGIALGCVAIELGL